MKHRILVVDDSRTQRQLVQLILAPEPYVVELAGSGEEALAMIRNGGIDLVLLDVVMPGMDGIETCRRIRQELELPLLPVIMITALADSESRTRGKEAGADDFLTKPAIAEELLVRIRNLLLLCTYYTRVENEARRWKLVSEVAALIARCRDYEGLEEAIRALLGPRLGVAGACFFEISGDDLQFLSARPRRVHWDRERWLAALDFGRVIPVSAGGPGGEPFATLLREREVPAGAVLSIHAGGELQEILLLALAAPLGDAEVTLLEDLAAHLGNAVGNVRSQLKSRELAHARERMSALLVHDLKNPLTVVSMNLSAIANRRLSESERQEALRDGRAAVEQLLGMVLDLLDIGRAEEGFLPIDRQDVDVAELVREVVATYRATAKALNVSFGQRIEAGLRAPLDPKLVRRVLENLLNNSFRYVSARGKVDVEVERAGELSLAIKVSNDGPTIPPEVRRHLFEKYGVVHAGQSAANRGLGLYLCRLVVDQHGGSIGVSDAPGGGVIFEVRLPAG